MQRSSVKKHEPMKANHVGQRIATSVTESLRLNAIFQQELVA